MTVIRSKPARPCNIEDCWQKQPCPEPGHDRKRTSARRRRRTTSYKRRKARYDHPGWIAASKAFLGDYPACWQCPSPSEVVDHIVPIGLTPGIRFMDKTNWQALCKPCHDRKTVELDGGFGNPVARPGDPRRYPPQHLP